MAEQTPNYKLNKPGFEDFADIRTLNENWDTIDGILAGKADIQIGGDTPTGKGVVLWFSGRPSPQAQSLPPLECSADTDGKEVRIDVDGTNYGVLNAKVGGEPDAKCNYVFTVKE